MEQKTMPPAVRPGSYSPEEIAEMQEIRTYLRESLKAAQKYLGREGICSAEYNRQAGIIAVTAAAGLVNVTKILKDVEREQARRPVAPVPPPARFP